jgi:hypothetical protein
MARREMTQQRIEWAYRRLLEARSTSAVVTELADTQGISRRQARRYVALAYQELTADLNETKVSRPEMVAKLTHALEEALSKALASNQPAAVVGAARQISDLLLLTPQATAGRGPFGSYGRSRNG